jgi:hypothetical protein
MEPGGLLPSLQELVTGTPFGDADETIANFHNLFLSNRLGYYPHIYLYVSQAVSSFVSRFTSYINFLTLPFVIQATPFSSIEYKICNLSKRNKEKICNMDYACRQKAFCK